MTRTLLALALTALTLPAAHAAPPVTDAQYLSVLKGDWRTPENRARDPYRHPRETLTFFALAPNQTVIEITPGNGWYSELLAPLLKDQGHYIAALQAPESGDYYRKAAEGLEKKFDADPARYGNAELISYNPSHPILGKPGSADRVLTFRNVHNWVEAGTAPAMFSAFYKVLKPGGILGVEDHRAKPGAKVDDTGYLPTDYVVKLATDAGFRLEGQSEVNANPRDTKDYPAGVWTLPPTLRLGEQDKAKYQAIGESDRFTLRFIKPAQ